ncbi:MAG: L-aspartate oxidase [Alphaproteobacteria bacterium]|nr:L-aspartate oxidase [Alphaproteobacteria bacterium]MBO6627976.1 L-aspartate oxidase [Alphaproteobacteria bacterium]MDF1625546.1 L-aspartate oxidase [Parvibaculaceae bacterium]
MSQTHQTGGHIVNAGDVLIVGAGLAGLFTALKLAPRPVTVLAEAPIGDGASSTWAQGGIAAAISEGDTPEEHAADTIEAGAGIVDPEIAQLLAEEAPARIQDLLSLGVPFDRDLEGRLTVGLEAAHSRSRIVHVQGDRAGRAIMEALIAAVRATPSIHIVEGFSAYELAVEDGRVAGVFVRPTGDMLPSPLLLRARSVVLASGGSGGLYAVTTNPLTSRGEGFAMAARAGATIADPEFVQFHPTAITGPRDPAPLATEALRGAGATLIDEAGMRFMKAVHDDAELAPRDIVARAIARVIQEGGKAYLDARDAVGDRFPTAFPTVYGNCQLMDINPIRHPIPVAPAMHYHMGGVLVDADGHTSLPGLWACGEVASTGAHGANRLASNSLLEAVVFGARIALDILRTVEPSHDVPRMPMMKAIPRQQPPSPIIKELRQLMTNYVGVVREETGLRHALREILRIERAVGTAPSLVNMVTAAKLITVAALQRQESRGGHFRADYPQTDVARQHRTFITLDEANIVAQTVLDTPSSLPHQGHAL